jgi:hypothetical protein
MRQQQQQRLHVLLRSRRWKLTGSGEQQQWLLRELGGLLHT